MVSEENKRRIWRIVRLTTGWALLGLGVVGLFLPFLQGFLLIASGLAVLSTESRWAKDILDRFAAWRHRVRKGRDSG